MRIKNQLIIIVVITTKYNDNNNSNKMKNFGTTYINENLYPLVRNNLNINPINLNRIDVQGDGN